MKQIKRTTTISFLNQKGGSGKTTLATNFSRALQKQNYNVLLVDSDPQGSARDWNEVNQGELIPVVGLDRESLAKDIVAISQGYDWVVIDGAPQIARLSAAAVKASDIVIVPVQPSPYDIWACADLIEIIKSRQEISSDLIAAFLINRAIKNTKLESEIKVALKDFQVPLLDSYTTQRVAYPTTASEGNTVFESTDKKAIEEIENITKEILKVLNNGTTS